MSTLHPQLLVIPPLLSATAFADTLRLRDGRVFEGIVVEDTVLRVTIDTHFGGISARLTFERAEVEKMTRTGAGPLTTTDGGRPAGEASPVTGGGQPSSLPVKPIGLVAPSGTVGAGAKRNDDFEKASSLTGREKLHLTTDVVFVGDLKVRFERLSLTKRRLAIRARNDKKHTGFVDVELPMFGITCLIENASKGAVARPFPVFEQLGVQQVLCNEPVGLVWRQVPVLKDIGDQACSATDNFGNNVSCIRLECNTEWEFMPSSRETFVLTDMALMPGESRRVLVPLQTPEIQDVRFFVVRLRIFQADPGSKPTDVFFYVPKGFITWQN